MRTLHIVDGESCGGSLRLSGLARGKEILAWRDALYTGPVPPDLTLHGLSRVRSLFWTNGGNAKELDKRDAHLNRYESYANIALWFGPDCVLCQLSLMQLLSWFREQGVCPKRLSWVALHGGELRFDQMAGAYASRRPITTAQMRLAERVWRAFRQPSPKPLARLLESDLNAIPRLRQVTKRILQEYPSTRNGLSRLEGLLLREIQRRGSVRAAEAVGAIKETVGDLLVFDMLRNYVRSSHPLVEFAKPFDGNIRSRRFDGSILKLSDMGERVLSGAADAIERNGVDRWIGGVHLQGKRVPWRWNERLQMIVTAG
jgi:hypothetical protein